MSNTESPTAVPVQRLVRRFGRAAKLAILDAKWPIMMFVTGMAAWKLGVDIKQFWPALRLLCFVGGLVTMVFFVSMAVSALWLWLRDVWIRADDTPNVESSATRRPNA